MASLILFVVGTVAVLALVFVPRRLLRVQFRVPRGTVPAVVGAALGVAGGYGLFLLTSPPAPPPGPPPVMDQTQGSGVYKGSHQLGPHLVQAEGGSTEVRPLEVGAKLPPLVPQWLNGPPPDHHGVLVVDVWDDT